MSIYGWPNYLTAVILMAASVNASAIDCYQESPGFSRDSESYFDIDEPEPVTNRQQSHLSNLFSPFMGKRLKGKGTSFECVGPERSAKKLFKKYTITADIQQHADGQLVISIEFFDEKKNITHRETLRYFGRNNPFHILDSSNNKLIVSAKLRIQKVLNELIAEISVHDNTLMISQTRYRNGYFAVQQTMSLNL